VASKKKRASVVFLLYEVLFGESVVGNSFVPPEIHRNYARFLQETAHQAVAKEQQQPESEAKAKLSKSLTLHASFEENLWGLFFCRLSDTLTLAASAVASRSREGRGS
jgi:hypothetical protein